MIVSHARKFIFFHNPKVAGTSFRDALKPYHDDPFTFWGIFQAPYFRNQLDHTHLRLWEMQALFPKLFACTETYNSLIFVRGPRARFLSALNEHFKKFQPQIALATMPPEQRVAAVEGFVKQVLKIAWITTDWRFIHFSPQLWYLQLGERMVPRHVIGLDGSGAFWQAGLDALGLPGLPPQRENISPVDLSAALESAVVRNFITTFYADDIAYFRSQPHLVALADQ